MKILKKYQFSSDEITERFSKLCSGIRFVDIAFHKPRKFIDRHNFKTLKQAKDNEDISIILRFERIQENLNRCKYRKKIYKFVFFDRNEDLIEIIFFGKTYLNHRMKQGERYVVCGKFLNENKIIHPDKILRMSELPKLPKFEAIYPTSEGITNNFLLSVMKKIVLQLPDQIEWIDEKILKKNKWQNWKSSVRNLHLPECLEDFYLSRQRLAFDEMIAMYLAIEKTQDEIFSCKKKAIKGDGRFLKLLLSRIGFDLTQSQKSAIDKVFLMQNRDKKMLSLLQGDVGSGKTMIILAAMLNAAECGLQSVLLVPTSILAKQHFENFTKLLPEIEIVMLLGVTLNKKREKILEQISCGNAKIIIGTHALLSDDVIFSNLSLVIVDEQHRFGAGQRTKLLEKNKMADLLLVSATPIPRTIAQILFGSILHINIEEKPKNRKKVETVLIKKNKIDLLISRLQTAISEGSKIFWVCPLVEENDDLKKISVDGRYRFLQKYFGNNINFIHGGMKEDQINKKIEEFRCGKIKIILSTTVIEVGVDVPDADIMIIENAEIFGLAQLHQLRGRVGRGEKNAFCVLIYDELVISPIAKQRLKILKNSDDGFFIAEEDFKLRGSGEIFGVKQSGFYKFRFINEKKDAEFFQIAAQQAKNIIKNNKIYESELLIKTFFPGNNYYL